MMFAFSQAAGHGNLLKVPGTWSQRPIGPLAERLQANCTLRPRLDHHCWTLRRLDATSLVALGGQSQVQECQSQSSVSCGFAITPLAFCLCFTACSKFNIHRTFQPVRLISTWQALCAVPPASGRGQNHRRPKRACDMALMMISSVGASEAQTLGIHRRGFWVTNSWLNQIWAAPQIPC